MFHALSNLQLQFNIWFYKYIFFVHFNKQTCLKITCKIKYLIKEIRQWQINWCTSLMVIQKITPSVVYNEWLKRLDTQLNEPTKKIQWKSPKVLSLRIIKGNYKTLGTVVKLNNTEQDRYKISYFWTYSTLFYYI